MARRSSRTARSPDTPGNRRMLTVASAPPGITFERKPPSTMVLVNVVRMSALRSGPKSLRRITRRPIRRMRRLP